MKPNNIFQFSHLKMLLNFVQKILSSDSDFVEANLLLADIYHSTECY